MYTDTFDLTVNSSRIMDDFIFFATLHIIWILKRITFIRSIISNLHMISILKKIKKTLKQLFCHKTSLEQQDSLRQYQKQPDSLSQVGF